MGDRMNWEMDGRDWPHRAASRFVTAGGLDWHVQVMGEGPALLLLHGTGASTHSWAGLMPLLARHFALIAPDLPGHAFTSTPGYAGLSLPGMARSVGALLDALRLSPVLAVGHSAGAAILIRMALDGLIAPAHIVSLNGALVPFQGLAGHIFSPLAKLIALNPLVPRLLSWRASDRRAVERLLKDTGSDVPADSIDLYARLFRSPSHVSATLGMMAAWDLDTFARELPKLRVPLVLAAGSGDRTVAPADAERVRSLAPAARIVSLPGLGHLAHEERPDLVASLVSALPLPGAKTGGIQN